jgi:hypothetical protein
MSGEFPSSASMKALGINFCSRLRPVLVRGMNAFLSVSGEIYVAFSAWSSSSGTRQ